MEDLVGADFQSALAQEVRKRIRDLPARDLKNALVGGEHGHAGAARRPHAERAELARLKILRSLQSHGQGPARAAHAERGDAVGERAHEDLP